MRVIVYVEGGGDSQALRTRCRQGFSSFFSRAGLSGRMPAIVACGSRNDAYFSYRTAVASSANENVLPLLLVDSEAAVTRKPWDHLKDNDNWDRPANARDEHAHLMVQCMEAWFLADRQLLANFYGRDFTDRQLPANPNVEEIPKSEIFRALKMATRQCKTKGEYGKGKHSFEILGQLNPDKVQKTSKHAQRLIETLDKHCQS